MLTLIFYDAEQQSAQVAEAKMSSSLVPSSLCLSSHSDMGTGIIDLSLSSISAALPPPPLKPGERPGRVNIPSFLPARTTLPKKIKMTWD